MTLEEQGCAMCYNKNDRRDFSGGTGDKTLSVNAGDMGLIPGPGRFHMTWGN